MSMIEAEWQANIDSGMSRANADERAYEDLRDEGFTHDEALDEMETF